MAIGPVLTIHRAADEIGGNCIELEHDGHRLLLDAGSPLVGDGTTEPQGAIPRTLDTSKDIAGLVISHPHQDHWGLSPRDRDESANAVPRALAALVFTRATLSARSPSRRARRSPTRKPAGNQGRKGNGPGDRSPRPLLKGAGSRFRDPA
jgi:glyoxylase-like metal-dependent hydrolase (beta-lactamase superfamily II)